MSLWKPDFNSSRYIPRSGVAESLATSIFKLLRNYHPVFNNSCTISHSHQQGTRLPISPCAPQHLFYVFCLLVLTVALLTDVVYHCNFDWHDQWQASFHVFGVQLCVFFKNMSVQVLCPVLNWVLLLLLLLLNFSCLYNMDINPLSDI